MRTKQLVSQVDKQGANYAQRAAASTQRTSRGVHQECDALTMTIAGAGGRGTVNAERGPNNKCRTAKGTTSRLHCCWQTHTRTHEHTHRLTQRAHVCTCVCVSVIAMQIERFILRDLRIQNESQYWYWKQCKQSQHSQSQSQSRTEHSRLFRWFCKLNCNEVMPWPGFHWWWGC